MFQFHKVRLKEIIVVIGQLVAWFQFHKVRLKEVERSARGITVVQVSIPQGTIKRQGDVQQYIESPVVSIPQGTIKSYEVEKQSYSTNLVSIPQGTIKSIGLSVWKTE